MSLSVPPLQGATSQRPRRDRGFPLGRRVRGCDRTVAAAPCRKAGDALASPRSRRPHSPSPHPCSAGGRVGPRCNPSLGLSGVSPHEVPATLMFWGSFFLSRKSFLPFRRSLWGPGCIAQQVPAWGCGMVPCRILGAVPCSSPCAGVTPSAQVVSPCGGTGGAGSTRGRRCQRGLRAVSSEALG